MNALESIIRNEIGEHGPMRFDRFMELALYHPEHGYYAKPRPVGRAGDFYTSVSVGPLFGQLLARQARQMARLLGASEFWIIEQGAHDGQLAHDILSSLRANETEFFEALRYAIVEPSQAARKARQEKLAEFGAQVRWVSQLSDWEGERPCGLFFSNELVDAFPVRLIERGVEAWKERCVVINQTDAFAWNLDSISDEELLRAVSEQLIPEAPGFRTEMGIAARKWMREVGGFLRRGYVLTIDYGFPASVYYAPFRSEGTLTCYRQHRRGDEVLSLPGEQDITAHVDFSALVRVGASVGLETLGLIDQQRFLTGIAHEELSGARNYLPAISDQARALQMLTHPEHLGTRFQALLQAKDAPGGLDGLRFARAGGWD